MTRYRWWLLLIIVTAVTITGVATGLLVELSAAFVVGFLLGQTWMLAPGVLITLDHPVPWPLGVFAGCGAVAAPLGVELRVLPDAITLALVPMGAAAGALVAGLRAALSRSGRPGRVSRAHRQPPGQHWASPPSSWLRCSRASASCAGPLT